MDIIRGREIFYVSDVDMRVIGIDPGVSGAMAIISGQPGAMHVEAVLDLPTCAEKTSSGKTRRYIDPVKLAAMLKEAGPADRIIVERLSAPPGISGLAAYSLGATSATLATVLRLAGLSFKLVSPVVWKRALDVPADKEAARQYASRLFDERQSAAYWPRRKDHNRAEAAMLAAYAIASA